MMRFKDRHLRLLSEPWLACCRVLTLCGLRLLLPQRARHVPYEPDPGSLLYVAASCLPYHTSGYTRRTHELCRALEAGGAVLSVMTRPGYPWDRKDREATPLEPETRLDGVVYAHERVPSKFRPVWLYAMQAAPVIARVARQKRVAAIQAASNHVNALPALFAARKLGVPFFYEMRGLWELTRASRMPAYEGSQSYRQGLALEAFVAGNADRVFVISERLGRYLTEHWAIPQERIFLLPNCVDPELLSPAEGALARPTAIVYAGSLIGYEGLDVLINAVDLLSARGRAVLVYIAGDGEERTALEEQVRSLTLSHQIRFLGKVSPKSACELVREAVFVCIPRRPFRVCKLVPPIKLVEALALGKPVIVPDMPLFHDELGDSGAGFFFRPGDPLDLAETIVRLLDDDALRENAGCRARAYAAAHRNWQHFIPAIID
ncbi:glycosyltransferase [Desulfovibrio sp. OttesenSCG-928-G11]|nr:glycosyltransferase [Desulfovibrio sp. OttesenSCG-928-G11]